MPPTPTTPKAYERPTAGDIERMWTECVDDMIDVRRNYWVNASYYHGDQWIGWDDTNARVTLQPFLNDEDAKYRATVNLLKPRTTSMVARLCRTPLGFEPQPAGVDAGALRTARIEAQVLRAKHHHQDWEQLRDSEIQALIFGGVSAVCIEPDWEWESEPVTDMLSGETILLPKRPSPKLTALSAPEFGIEPGSRDAITARYWIRATTLTPKQAMERYDLDTEPTPDSDAGMTAMQRNLLTARRRMSQKNNACIVYTYYERPCAGSPGCVIHVVGKKVVEESDWPFPFSDRLNVQPFVQTKMDGTWKGDTFFNDCRQLQRNYNLVQTSINKHIGKADNARMLLPQGAVLEGDDEMTGEAGEYVRYDPNAGGKPEWMQAPQIPRWLRENKDELIMQLDDLFSQHAVSRGQAPGDRNSGTALAILAEKDETPLGRMATNQQRGWQAIAEMVLRLERHLMETANQLLQSAGAGEMQVEDALPGRPGVAAPEPVQYRASDLSVRPTVHVPLESVMPRSQVAVQDQMIRLAQSFPLMFQSLDPQQMAAVLQVPDQAAFAYVADPQLSLAEWENGRMVAGAGDEEVAPAEWHDHDKHVQKHNELRASASYREADFDTQRYIDLHIQAHAMLAREQMMAMQQQMMAMQPPQGVPEGGGGPAPEGAPVEQPQGVPA